MLSHENKSVEKLESILFAKKNQRMCPITVKKKGKKSLPVLGQAVCRGKTTTPLGILLFGKQPGVGSALYVVSKYL